MKNLKIAVIISFLLIGCSSSDEEQNMLQTIDGIVWDMNIDSPSKNYHDHVVLRNNLNRPFLGYDKKWDSTTNDYCSNDNGGSINWDHDPEIHTISVLDESNMVIRRDYGDNYYIHDYTLLTNKLIIVITHLNSNTGEVLRNNKYEYLKTTQNVSDLIICD